MDEDALLTGGADLGDGDTGAEDAACDDDAASGDGECECADKGAGLRFAGRLL